MAHRGRRLDRRTLIATRASGALAIVLLLVTAARVDAQLGRIAIALPRCEPTHLDRAMLEDLLRIELDDLEGDHVEVEIGEALCDPSAQAIDVAIRDRGRSRDHHETIEQIHDADPTTSARMLALAIAERARLLLGRRVVPPPDTAPIDEIDAIEPPEPSRARETLASPFGSETESPPPSAATEPLPADALKSTLTSAAIGRIAPVLPSWAIGTRALFGAWLDPMFSLDAGILFTGTRASPREGNVDAIVLAVIGRAGLTLHRAQDLTLRLLAATELGFLVASGAPPDAAGRTTFHPWFTLGASLELALHLHPLATLTLEAGAQGVLAGTRVYSTSGPQIDLSTAVIDLSVGVRTPLF